MTPPLRTLLTSPPWNLLSYSGPPASMPDHDQLLAESFVVSGSFNPHERGSACVTRAQYRSELQGFRGLFNYKLERTGSPKVVRFQQCPRASDRHVLMSVALGSGQADHD